MTAAQQAKRFLPALIVFVLAMAPLFSSNGYVLGVALDIALFCVLTIGLNVVIGYAGLLDLGYAAFYAIGAYTTALLLVHTNLSFWLIWPIAGIAAGIFGVIIGSPTLRLRSDYLAIVTLGFGEITRITVTNLSITGSATGFYNLRPPVLFGTQLLSTDSYYVMAIAMVGLGLLVSYLLRRSRLGIAWMYVKHDEELAQALGVNPLASKLWAYGLGAVWGGLAGAVFVEAMTAVSPTSFTFDESLMVVIAVVLGGQGSLYGALLGGAIAVGLPEIFRPLQNMRLLLFGIVIVAMMILRPEGIIPEGVKRIASRTVRRSGSGRDARTDT